MGLGTVVKREPDAEVPASDAVIYRAFIDALGAPTTPERAILRAAARCGVSRRRALAVVIAVNADLPESEKTYP